MPAQINPEESELLYLVQSDDESAFRTIYIMYSPRLYKNILRFVRIEEVAQDLLHDLFIKVWDKRHTIDPQKPFKAFIRLQKTWYTIFSGKLRGKEILKTCFSHNIILFNRL